MRASWRVLLRNQRTTVPMLGSAFPGTTLEALEDGFPKERFQREPGERWRSEGTSQHVVHAGGHVLRRVRFDRLYGDIPDRREAWRGRRWHRGPRRSQEWTSIAGCARSSGLRGNRRCFGKLVIKR
ncbi:uncharacterized protein LOC105681123 isoform X2 [Bombus impatiens]|uniref:Uncharacterized protein LOC105681123 isoform X2 n=1 Tax=Bombus impatiens TaxID=132113 RepID=A0A6P3UYX6_BOMIM|nr:uncharacterized protein LOC105681123 isoform X2 [Bombus impatiens]